MRQVLFISMFLMTMTSFAQDSTAITQRDGFKKWTKYRTSLRLGLGIQNRFFTEVGISRHKYIYNDLGYASSAKYLSLEVSPKFNTLQNIVYGLKVGYELNARVLALGLETKYQTDFTANDFVITPKVGLGILGVVNIFYGYNISTNSTPFSTVKHNQFSIVTNLNKRFFEAAKLK